MNGTRPYIPFSKEAIDTFIKSLNVTWEGMTGVFFAMGIILITIFILERSFRNKGTGGKKDDIQKR